MMGAALAAREKGSIGPQGLMGMSLEDLRDYAGTPEKGLPKKVKKKKG